MSVEELHAPFDPAKEPLEVTVVKEHEDDGIVVRRLTYVVGTFKGRKSVMGAFHAYPKQRDGKLPGIVQMHGGGLDKKILGLETVDHPTDRQIVAYARAYFGQSSNIPSLELAAK